MQKITYRIEKGQFCGEEEFRITRFNRIGQGWHIATYSDEEVADAVAMVLNEFADMEV